MIQFSRTAILNKSSTFEMRSFFEKIKLNELPIVSNSYNNTGFEILMTQEIWC